MKKTMIFVLICCFIFTLCFSACSSSGEKQLKNEDDFFLSYLPSEPQLKGSKLYVNGLLSNGSNKYDIVDISNIKIVVTDKSGNEQTRITLNSKFANNCVISPYGTVAYNFTCDVSNFTVQSIWDLRYEVIGEYSYIECEGNNCNYCGGSNSNTYIPDSKSDSEYTTTTCFNCKGSGICSECNGSGKNDYDGVLAAYGCTLCGKTGKCHKCGGSGYIKIY